MRPNLGISFSKEFKAVGDVEPAFVKEMLYQYLPPGTRPPKPTMPFAIY
jgi:hypothetical protein